MPGITHQTLGPRPTIQPGLGDRLPVKLRNKDGEGGAGLGWEREEEGPEGLMGLRALPLLCPRPAELFWLEALLSASPTVKKTQKHKNSKLAKDGLLMSCLGDLTPIQAKAPAGQPREVQRRVPVPPGTVAVGTRMQGADASCLAKFTSPEVTAGSGRGAHRPQA